MRQSAGRALGRQHRGSAPKEGEARPSGRGARICNEHARIGVTVQDPDGRHRTRRQVNDNRLCLEPRRELCDGVGQRPVLSGADRAGTRVSARQTGGAGVVLERVCRLYFAPLRALRGFGGLLVRPSGATGHVAPCGEQRGDRTRWDGSRQERDQGDHMDQPAKPTHFVHYNPRWSVTVPVLGLRHQAENGATSRKWRNGARYRT